ncbi:N-acetylmuramoyl-L-alanine amidase [Chengkuizengella axinellae]|uniref:N-acetylmuramoyl-L-alanine amidase n=1 Tax=Chengkuizengella axinellae TaxID=3064388 RepID=A0ABT9ITQ3_9BACL|nr:N-acetylmuramoyl-L-alanine amidase [Chengkuizengella sp. 2205SS18-9]MDP5272723.1 N-acetylmuramoyl-L-alanine amidase [Chengkuizengella sp. 2205SS18-9]
MEKWKHFVVFLMILFVVFPNYAQALKVVIDAGHGGSDPGAIGVNELNEKDVNLDISFKLRNILEERGHEVILTRDSDTYISLQDRVKFTNQQNADLFVSIHANAHHDPSIQGSLVIYYNDRYPDKKYPASKAMSTLSPYSRSLALSVLDGLVTEAETKDLGLMSKAVYVARMGTIPSILVETAFLSNQEDAARLFDDNERQKMALGIANGIESFEPITFWDVLNHWAMDSIVRLEDAGLIGGYNNSYEPNRGLTRAEFLAMMDRIFYFTSDQDENISEDENEQNEPLEDLRDEDEQKTSITENETSQENDPSEQENSSNDLQNETSSNENETANVTDDFSTTKETNTEITNFKDLSPDHWAYAVVTEAVNKGYILGYPDETIRPNEPISRAEVAVVFERIWNKGEPILLDEEFQYEDIPLEKWYTEAVYLLKEFSLLNGITESTFEPERNMTRAELAVMVDRFLTQK